MEGGRGTHRSLRCFYKATLKKSVFPVQVVAEIMATRAAANCFPPPLFLFFFFGKKSADFFFLIGGRGGGGGNRKLKKKLTFFKDALTLSLGSFVTNTCILKTSHSFTSPLPRLISQIYLAGEIKCEPPNNRLNKYEGNMKINDNLLSLDNDKLLLRGCVLRNTRWCYGMVVFAGKDTKLMMNSGQSVFKRTHIDRLVDVLIIGVRHRYFSPFTSQGN